MRLKSQQFIMPNRLYPVKGMTTFMIGSLGLRNYDYHAGPSARWLDNLLSSENPPVEETTSYKTSTGIVVISLCIDHSVHPMDISYTLLS